MQAQQIQLSGMVVNEKNKPIENVNVYLEDSFDGALTDTKGYFSFTMNDTVVRGVLKLMHPQYGNLDIEVNTKESLCESYVLRKQDEVMGRLLLLQIVRISEDVQRVLGLLLWM